MKKIILILMALVLIAPLALAQVGKNYETNCENGICTTNVYSYQKYYQDDGKWKEIDENFGTENCEEGFDYCVDGNLYQFNANLSSQKITYKNSLLTFGLNKLQELTLDKPRATISGNILNYSGIYDGIDLVYTYLPNKIKEEIVISDQEIFSNVDDDIEITFDLDSHGDSIHNENDGLKIGDTFIRNLVAYDSGISSVDLPMTLIENTLNLKIPIDWLNNENLVYPIFIDPTIGINTSVNKDVEIVHTWDNDGYSREDLKIMNLGLDIMGGRNQSSRFAIDFDISGIPTDAEILDINLTIWHKDAIPYNNTASFNENISVVSMDGNATDYSDDAAGNQNYWEDMGNGTNYIIIYEFDAAVSRRPLYINLTNASSDFEAQLEAQDTFSVGFWSLTDSQFPQPDPDVSSWYFRSSTADQTDERPVLIVTYFVNGSNESAGDDAIEQGILNALPNATIHDEQQVYTRLANGTQQLGRFDKFAVYGNQRWGFNYVTDGEDFTYMNNVSSQFFVLEMEDLFADDIESLVEEFIELTIV